MLRTQSSVIACLCSLILFCGCEQKKEAVKSTPPPVKNVNATLDQEVVELACGQCLFDMDGDGCELAIRYQGEDYLVDGSKLDDHGDAHAADGMCMVVRKAKVSGEIKDGRFTATSVELLEYDPSEAPKDPDEDNDDEG